MEKLWLRVVEYFAYDHTALSGGMGKLVGLTPQPLTLFTLPPCLVYLLIL